MFFPNLQGFEVQGVYVRMCAQSIQSCLPLCDPMNCSPPGSSVHGILQTRIWNGLPCPPPGDLLDAGIKSMSLKSPALQMDSLPTEPPGKPSGSITVVIFQAGSSSN